MRVFKSAVTLFLIISIAANLPFLISACKKNSNLKSPADSIFSFTYNGTRYVLPYKEGTSEWSIIPGIYINRLDLFNGIIHFPHANCAYLDPQNNGLQVQMEANCQLSTSGMPIDSIAVYIYQSGSFNLSYTNCVQKKEYDFFTSSYIYYDVCDVYGTFNLTLKNKENKTIIISEGKLEVYRLAI